MSSNSVLSTLMTLICPVDFLITATFSDEEDTRRSPSKHWKPFEEETVVPPTDARRSLTRSPYRAASFGFVILSTSNIVTVVPAFSPARAIAGGAVGEMFH